MAARCGVVVAIDGPAGAGKSTVARAVADRAGLCYLDTGALYRAMTLAVLQAGVDPAAIDGVAEVATGADLSLEPGADGRTLEVRLAGRPPGGALRDPAVNAAVSTVAAVPAVRARLLRLQRDAIGDGGVVVEGRDIGTVVWPRAAVKVFLTADAAERARRRAGAGAAGES